MSGFIALFNIDGAPVDRELLRKLTASLQFKGPDKQKVRVDGSVGLGHALFKTTHESEYENQPASLEQNVWITGNIRIDGRRQLVNQLGLKDEIQLETTADSELVLHAYRKWGKNFLTHLLGDFAFAIWDGHKKQLICARDRFGMRQLYHSRVGNTIVISNSMHCQLQHPAISKQLNEQAIGDFLLMGDHVWVDQAQTSFADIQTLPPAHLLVVKAGVVNTQRYWGLPDDIPLLRYRNEQDYLDQFREVFKEAVADRLRTSRVVIALSGGLDSSAIAATVREIQASGQQTLELDTVTVLYDSIHSSDEKHFAELVKQQLNLPGQYIDGGSYPFMSPPIPTTRPIELYQPALWLDVARTASTMGRVILTGEAGDNLLVGSTILKTLKDVNPFTLMVSIQRLKALYGRSPPLGSGLKAKFNRLSGNHNPPTLPYPGWLNPEFEARLDLKQRWSEINLGGGPSSGLRYANLYESLLGADWNSDEDFMQTPFTLPAKRDPFLDLRLVEFVASLPTLPWLFNKHILRSSMHERLPGEVLKRRKTALGTIHSSLITQPNSIWNNNWQSGPELDQFIDRKKVPEFNEKLNGTNKAYLSLRPYLLKSWLSGL